MGDGYHLHPHVAGLAVPGSCFGSFLTQGCWVGCQTNDSSRTCSGCRDESLAQPTSSQSPYLQTLRYAMDEDSLVCHLPLRSLSSEGTPNRPKALSASRRREVDRSQLDAASCKSLFRSESGLYDRYCPAVRHSRNDDAVNHCTQFQRTWNPGSRGHRLPTAPALLAHEQKPAVSPDRFFFWPAAGDLNVCA